MYHRPNGIASGVRPKAKRALVVFATLLFAWLWSLPVHAKIAKLTTLYSFQGSFGGPDGVMPVAKLLQARDGNFYSTTSAGGESINCNPPGCGTIFRITASGHLTTLWSFDGLFGEGPATGLVEGVGDFYGTTAGGGGPGKTGTLYRVTQDGLQMTVLHSFDGDHGGASPSGDLIVSDSKFYGTAAYGGEFNMGTVYSSTQEGSVNVLYAFDITHGAAPIAGLVEGPDGMFYGTTAAGGNQNLGTVFKIARTGVLTTLHAFKGSDGSGPGAELILGSDGRFYGTTVSGGPSNGGTTFRITAGGQLTTLHSFSGPDGMRPYAALFQARDGNFYGTTAHGGSSTNCTFGCGTIFKLTAAGHLTTLHSFDGWDGAQPMASLILADDDKFYGTTMYGGSLDAGTVFKLVYLKSTNAPTFDPPGGKYLDSVTVTISDTTPGATIYYTTDGSIPTRESAQYTSPLTLTKKTALRAFAVAGKLLDSPLTAGNYRIK